jgi:hypothetical protein
LGGVFVEVVLKAGKVINKDGEERRKIITGGYVAIHAPDHPRAVGYYVLEHILIAEQMLGRPLADNEIVHHKNRCPWDNRPANLKVTTRIPHWTHHRYDKARRDWNSNAKNCGPVIKYNLKDREG